MESKRGGSGLSAALRHRLSESIRGDLREHTDLLAAVAEVSIEGVPPAATVIFRFEVISDASRHLLAKAKAGLGTIASHSRRVNAFQRGIQ